MKTRASGHDPVPTAAAPMAIGADGAPRAKPAEAQMAPIAASDACIQAFPPPPMVPMAGPENFTL